MSSWLKFDFSSNRMDGWREELAAKATRLHEVLFTKVRLRSDLLEPRFWLPNCQR